MKKILAVVCVVAMMLSLSIVAGAEEKKAITITTAEELAGMANDLTADYILDADIDLAGITWNPIGTYKPSGESEGGRSLRLHRQHRGRQFHTGKCFDGGNHHGRRCSRLFFHFHSS